MAMFIPSSLIKSGDRFIKLKLQGSYNNLYFREIGTHDYNL